MSAADEAGKIEGFLKDMLEKLNLFQQLEAHFQSSSAESWRLLYSALTDFYVDVIDFTLITAKHYRSNIFSRWLNFLICVRSNMSRAPGPEGTENL